MYSGEDMSKKDPRKAPHRLHPNSLKALEEGRVKKPFLPDDKETGEMDPRRFRKTSPNSTAGMRALIRAIGADLVALQDTNLRGKKRTTIVSRVTKKIVDLYESPNPADAATLLRAGWPGLLSLEENQRDTPKEYVLKIVYENRRELPRDEVGEEYVDGVVRTEEEEPGSVGAQSSYGVGVPAARWEPDVATLDFIMRNQPGKYSRKGSTPTGPFYCVLCKEFREDIPTSSIEHGGWICGRHKA